MKSLDSMRSSQTVVLRLAMSMEPITGYECVLSGLTAVILTLTLGMMPASVQYKTPDHLAHPPREGRHTRSLKPFL